MSVKKIADLINARSSLVYLVSSEEERVERMILAGAKKALGRNSAVYLWSCLYGLSKGRDTVVASPDPIKGLEAYAKIKDDQPLIFKDLHLLIRDNTALVRQLRELARLFRTSKKAVFFIAPRLNLPEELYPLFKVMDIPLPSPEELSKTLEMAFDMEFGNAEEKPAIDKNIREKMVRAAQGLTTFEAMDAFRGSFMANGNIGPDNVDFVLKEKEALVRRGGVLEFVTPDMDKWEIGGLLNLKRWLDEREQAWSQDAAARGLAPPKGILAMGVSGCGKSLCIKTIAAYWKLPLLRLDMGKIYDGVAGSPEEAMRKAITTAEAVAPCVLWIDEIEAGIANQNKKAAGGEESRVLALFLTWMQEKKAPVFVGATANEVEVLPPEVLRKGRFDELFYVGLPTQEEREQIMGIHMKKRDVNPENFDMSYLAESTEGLNGAEIEEGVVSAIYESMANNKELTEHTLANAFRRIVPLSRTMRERIERIENWARDRAVKATLSKFEN
jgi:SpoVK/Ycf46/Vps4 family AAA+-type ATPase